MNLFFFKGNKVDYIIAAENEEKARTFHSKNFRNEEWGKRFTMLEVPIKPGTIFEGYITKMQLPNDNMGD